MKLSFPSEMQVLQKLADAGWHPQEGCQEQGGRISVLSTGKSFQINGDTEKRPELNCQHSREG